jgi:hypothetical protein
MTRDTTLQEIDENEAAEPWPRWAQRTVLPFLRDPGLRPVLLAILGHLAVVFTPVILSVVRSRNPLSGAALLVFLFGSFELIRLEKKCRGRFSLLTASVIGTWVVACILAAIGYRTNFI